MLEVEKTKFMQSQLISEACIYNNYTTSIIQHSFSTKRHKKYEIVFDNTKWKKISHLFLILVDDDFRDDDSDFGDEDDQDL